MFGGLASSVGAMCFTYYASKAYDSYRLENENLLQDVPFSVYLMKLVPLKLASKCWGALNNMYVPRVLRKPVYSAYAALTGVNLEDLREGAMDGYPCLNAFFARKLRDDARSIDRSVDLVCPSDGRILGFGRVETDSYSYVSSGSSSTRTRRPGGSVLDNIIIRNIKGFRFPLSQFLGEYTPLPSAEDTRSGPEHVHATMASSALSSTFRISEPYEKISFLEPVPKSLFYCTIYLAPGDYHRFHSPTDWWLHHIRHVHGEMLPVMPGILRLIPNVYVLNERVPCIGSWKYGRFSLTAVGSTNVGRIKIYGDRGHKNNRNFVKPWTASLTLDAVSPMDLRTGDEFGYFEMGSTIVLVFEAPENFRFLVAENQIVKMGQALGNVDSSLGQAQHP